MVQAGDELLVITEAEDVAAVRALFTMPAEEFAAMRAAESAGALES